MARSITRRRRITTPPHEAEGFPTRQISPHELVVSESLPTHNQSETTPWHIATSDSLGIHSTAKADLSALPREAIALLGKSYCLSGLNQKRERGGPLRDFYSTS
jgi:hypothetical protein